MIRITIVTITYNAERVLQRTLDSVLAQTYEGVEHLIVDGASKDGTLQLAEQYKAKSDVSDCGHKVIILSEPDHGIYDAMNKGLTQASGDYIVYMNAGDFFPYDDTLEKIVQRCQLNEQPTDELPGVLYGNTDIVDDEGHFLHPRKHQPLAVVPAGHAGVPPGFLCPYGHCQKPAVRHSLSFLCRCRLVHPSDEGNGAYGSTPV